MAKTSISAVARHAGVSTATVSKTLNGVVGFQISEAVRKRIMNAVKELDYQPNHVARMLVRGKSDIIGLIFFGPRDPYYFEISDAIETKALEFGYRVFVENIKDHREKIASTGNLAGWPLDGIIVVWHDVWDAIANRIVTISSRTPVVYITPEKPDGFDAVSLDEFQAAKLATQHVIDCGYKNPWYITPFSYRSNGERGLRTRAFEEVCDEHRIPRRVQEISTDDNIRKAGLEIGLEIANLPKDLRPDSVVCHNDVIAVGLYHGALRGGLRIPEDLALVGFDGLEEGAYLDKPLTTVSVRRKLICKRAVELLLTKIESGNGSAVPSITIQGELIRGATTKEKYAAEV